MTVDYRDQINIGTTNWHNHLQLNKTELKYRKPIEWIVHPWNITIVSEIESFSWTIHSANFYWDGNLMTDLYSQIQ